jgi:tripartite-type tricarboxylate transporter receptor subunit TctC
MVALASLAHAADDDAWPRGSVRVIVPYPAGGGTDIVARIVVDQLNERLGRHFIIENKDGATTLVGTEAVARSQPDGNTLLYTSTAYSINPSLQRHMPFDTAKSFAPIALTAFHPFVLLAHPSLGVSTLPELIALAKKEPGKINYASVGTGSSQHLEMELLKQLAGIDMAHVPFRGSAPAMNDLLGGHVSLMWNGLSPSIGLIREGKLRALAVDTKSRVAALADVPTIAEAGLQGFDIVTWSGLFAPAGAPKPIVDRLEAMMKDIVADPAVRDRLAKLGLQPGGLIGNDFASFLANDMNAWAKLVTATGARIE